MRGHLIAFSANEICLPSDALNIKPQPVSIVTDEAQGRIQEFLGGGGAGSLKRQVRRNFQTDKPKKKNLLRALGLDPGILQEEGFRVL